MSAALQLPPPLPLREKTVKGRRYGFERARALLTPKGRRYTLDDSPPFDLLGRFRCCRDTEEDKFVVVRSLDFELLPGEVARAVRELWLLRQLQHENLTQLLDVFVQDADPDAEAEREGSSHGGATEIHLVYEHMYTNFASVVRPPRLMTIEHIRFFIYQLLRGLKYLHSAEVIHGDLKPLRILVNQNCDLRICGLSGAIVRPKGGFDMLCGAPWPRQRGLQRSFRPWYSAPEIANVNLCGPAVDIWSAACVFAEMFLLEPLFRSDRTVHHFELIIRLLGNPTNEEVSYLDPTLRERVVSCAGAGQHGRSFAQVFGDDVPDLAKDLLRKMLLWVPGQRLTAAETLAHPFLNDLYCPEDEPTREPLDAEAFEALLDVSESQLDVQQLQEWALLEALKCHPDKCEIYKKDIEDRLIRCQVALLRPLCRTTAASVDGVGAVAAIPPDCVANEARVACIHMIVAIAKARVPPQ